MLTRSLLRAPLLSAAVILTFAAVTAIVATNFALVWHILIRQLPFVEGERLVFVWNRYGDDMAERFAMSPPDFADRRHAQSFESAAAWLSVNVNLTDGNPERLRGARVTDDFFRVLRVAPALGRPFGPGEEDAVLLSDGVWRRLFGARSDVVGKTVHLEGRAMRVAGVMPRGFVVPPSEIDIWLPLQFTPADLSDENRGNENLVMIARLRRGVTPARAQAEMDVITAAVRNRVPSRTAFLNETRWHVAVFSMRDDLVRRYRGALWLLFGASMLVLLLGAANVAGLFVARTAARQKELGVRVALGADRWIIAREITREVVALVFAGAVLGLFIAYAVTPLAANAGLPRAHEVRVGVEVAAFAIAIALTTAIIIGLLISAWASIARHSQLATRNFVGAPETTRLRSALVAAQVALAVMLLASGTLLLESYRRLRGVEIGFRPDGLLTFRVALPREAYPEIPRRHAFFTQMQERIAALPGVVSASATSDLPFSENDWTATFNVPGRDPALGKPLAHWRVVQPRYFETMRIPLREGRALDARDRDGAQLVCMIDETAARRYWPGESAIGKRLDFGARPMTIVGVAGSVRHGSLSDEAEPHVYMPLLQRHERELYGIVRVTGDPLRVAGDVRAIVASLDRAQPVFGVMTMNEYLDRAVAQPRLRAALVAIFAAVGVLLAVVGLAALLAYIVTSRTRELGVRIALGATRSEIAALVSRWSLRVTIIGAAIGVVGALLMARWMRSLLFGVDALQLRICFAAALLLAIVALLTGIAPALRASRIDPARALRQE